MLVKFLAFLGLKHFALLIHFIQNGLAIWVTHIIESIIDIVAEKTRAATANIVYPKVLQYRGALN